jgi:hypothetical protein
MGYVLSQFSVPLLLIGEVPPDGFQKMVQASLQEHLAQARGVDGV